MKKTIILLLAAASFASGCSYDELPPKTDDATTDYILPRGVQPTQEETDSVKAARAEYQEAIYITIPIIIGGFFSYLYSFPAIVEYYYEKTKFIAIGTMCAASINIFLNYIFIYYIV